ncbi:MAG: metalloregulator ArsR/SmtB family transcription factor [Cytophagales bacterium]|nr:metalloregulator ArsR/SmtB family transcription factor [Bernardetiaceae bacterium]MDW8210250.1 metalloregulator ArsR/SmtB family transcription factor [Cytophagales bacterium]
MSTEVMTLRVDATKLEKVAYMLKAVAHPVRIAIIDLLDQCGRLNVSELQTKLNIEQALLSHHLTNMRDRGILTASREGKCMYYALADAAITNIIHCINNCAKKL